MSSQKSFNSVLEGYEPNYQTQPPTEPYSEVLEERNALRQQNQQLWRIIEKQRLIIHQLQKYKNSASVAKIKSNGDKSHYPVLSRATQSNTVLTNKENSNFDDGTKSKNNEDNNYEISPPLLRRSIADNKDDISKLKTYDSPTTTDMLVEQEYKTAQKAQSIISSKYNQPMSYRPTVAENIYHTNPETSEAFKILKEANLKHSKLGGAKDSGFNKLRKATSDSTIRKSELDEKDFDENIDRKLSLNGMSKIATNDTNEQNIEVTSALLVPKRSSRRLKGEGLECLKEDTILSPISEKINQSMKHTTRIPDLRKGVKKEPIIAQVKSDEEDDVLGPVKGKSLSLNSGAKLSRYSEQKATLNKPHRSASENTNIYGSYQEVKELVPETQLSASAPTAALSNIPNFSPEATSPTYSEPNEPPLNLPPLPVETSRLIASRASSVVNDNSSVQTFSSDGTNSLHCTNTTDTKPIDIPAQPSTNHSRFNSNVTESYEEGGNIFFFPKPPSVDPPPHVRQSNSTLDANTSDDEVLEEEFTVTKLSEGGDSLANTSMVVNHGSYLPPPRSPTQRRLSNYTPSEKSSISASQVSLPFSEPSILNSELKGKSESPTNSLNKSRISNLNVTTSSVVIPNEEDFYSRIHFLKYQYSKLEIVSVRALQSSPTDSSSVYALILAGLPNPNILSPFPHSVVHHKPEPTKNEVWRLEKKLSQIIGFDEIVQKTLPNHLWPQLTPLQKLNIAKFTPETLQNYFSQLPLIETLDVNINEAIYNGNFNMTNYAEIFAQFLASNLAAPPLPPPQDNTIDPLPPPPQVDTGNIISPHPHDNSILPLKKKYFKAGNLLKRGKKLGKLKLRYFVVNGPSLEYFESKDGFYLGSINLTNAQVIRSMVASLHSDLYEKYVYAITVMEPKKSSLVKHTFFMDSHQDWDQWIESLDFFSKFTNQRPRGDSINDSHQHQLNHFNKLGQNTNIARPNKERPNLVIKTATHDQLHPNGAAPDTNYKVLSPAELPPNPISLYSNHAHTDSNNSLLNPSPSNAANPHVLPLPSDTSNLSTSLPKSDNPLKNKMMEFMDGKKASKKEVGDKERPSKAGTGVRKTFHWNTKNFFADAFKKQNHGQNKVFGVPLNQAIQQAPIKAGYHLPTVVYRCIEFLEYHKAYIEEGIYRLSGSAADIQHLKEKFDCDGDYNLLKSGKRYDVHTVAGLLKLYLREMPNYVLTQELQPEFVRVSEISERYQRVNELGRLVCALPLVNYTLLRTLTAHLIRIVEKCEVNKMTLRNIGIVFVPTLAIPAGVFSLMVVEFDYVFWTNEQGNAAPKTMLSEELPPSTDTSPTENSPPTQLPSTQPDPNLVGQAQPHLVLMKSPTLHLKNSPRHKIKDGNWRDSRNSVIYKDVVPQDLVTVEHPLDISNGAIDLNLDPNDITISDDEDIRYDRDYVENELEVEVVADSDLESNVQEAPILLDEDLPPPTTTDLQTEHLNTSMQVELVNDPYDFEDEVPKSDSKYKTIL